MRLHEAIESGRPFRRKGWNLDESMWCHAAPHRDGGEIIQFIEGRPEFHAFRADLVADDWEIQEPTVTITRTQFYDAFQAGLATAEVYTVGGVRTAIAAALGL